MYTPKNCTKMASAEDGTMAKIFGYRVDFMEELGRGAFGTVYKGYDENDFLLAVKKVSTASKEDKRKASTEAVRFHFLKDKLLQQNDHIVKIHDVKYFREAVWIVMEYCNLGDLNKFFKTHHHMLQDVETKVKLMRQIANGINFLHDRNIVHRDIKPGNILVKSTCNSCAVVQLGDFGLSKILDPDSLTSAMSSNVGTLSFKAPEFWDKKPDDRVLYHRNVDVYAAGLVFTAMLQAKPGRSLMPKAEGSLQHSETIMPIGLAAYSRLFNKQPDLNIVEVSGSDSEIVKRLKRLIRDMTHVSPDKRLSASAVETALTRMFGVARLNESTSWTSDFHPDALCFAGGNLVLRGHQWNCHNCVFKIYNYATGSLIKEWEGNCSHYFKNGSLVTIQIPDAEQLVEACPNSGCEVIRVHHMDDTCENSPTPARCQQFRLTASYGNIKPHTICVGPVGSLLVYDQKNKSILQLVRDSSTSKFSLFAKNKLDLGWPAVGGMTYIDKCHILVFTFFHSKQIMGFNFENKKFVWQYDGSVENIPLSPEDVCCTTEGWICVANGNNVLALDPTDGSLLEVLLSDNNLTSIHRIAWCNKEDSPRLAIRHGPLADNITCYDVTFKRNQAEYTTCPLRPRESLP